MKRLNFLDVQGLILLSLFLFSCLLFFAPELRTGLREFLAPPERAILSVASGRVLPGKTARVIKIKTPNRIIIEVHDSLAEAKPSLLRTIELPDKRDSFFQFQGRATNLALKDMDGDQVFEIIAPSYDASLVPRLNIFRFNIDTEDFEPYIE